MTFPPTSDNEVIVPVDLRIFWSVGAPNAVLLRDAWHTHLAVYLSPRDPSGKNIGIITFLGCHDAWMGGPNDEAIEGHRLWSHGEIDPFGAVEVLSSSWNAHTESVNRIHPRHEGERFRHLHHYILGLKEETLECLAQSVSVEKSDETMEQVLVQLVRRLGVRE